MWSIYKSLARAHWIRTGRKAALSHTTWDKPVLAFSPPPKGLPHAAQPIFPQLWNSDNIILRNTLAHCPQLSTSFPIMPRLRCAHHKTKSLKAKSQNYSNYQFGLLPWRTRIWNRPQKDMKKWKGKNVILPAQQAAVICSKWKHLLLVKSFCTCIPDPLHTWKFDLPAFQQQKC